MSMLPSQDLGPKREAEVFVEALSSPQLSISFLQPCPAEGDGSSVSKESVLKKSSWDGKDPVPCEGEGDHNRGLEGA